MQKQIDSRKRIIKEQILSIALRSSVTSALNTSNPLLKGATSLAIIFNHFF